MALQKFGILRSFAKQRLEGRTAAFFETSRSGSPPDEVRFSMASKKLVILRCFAKQSLEGRKAGVQRMALLLIALLAVAGCAAQRANTESDRPPTFYGGVSGGLTR